MTRETIIPLLADLIRRGVRFELVANGTAVRLVHGRMGVTDEEIAELRRYKPTLIRILRALEVTGGRIVHPRRFTCMDDRGEWN